MNDNFVSDSISIDTEDALSDWKEYQAVYNKIINTLYELEEKCYNDIEIVSDFDRYDNCGFQFRICFSRPMTQHEKERAFEIETMKCERIRNAQKKKEADELVLFHILKAKYEPQS